MINNHLGRDDNIFISKDPKFSSDILNNHSYTFEIIQDKDIKDEQITKKKGNRKMNEKNFACPEHSLFVFYVLLIICGILIACETFLLLKSVQVK